MTRRHTPTLADRRSHAEELVADIVGATGGALVALLPCCGPGRLFFFRLVDLVADDLGIDLDGHLDIPGCL